MTNDERESLEFRRALGRRVAAQKAGTASESLDDLNSDLLRRGQYLRVVGEHKTLLLLVLFSKNKSVGPGSGRELTSSIEVIFMVDMCAQYLRGDKWLLTKNRFGDNGVTVNFNELQEIAQQC